MRRAERVVEMDEGGEWFWKVMFPVLSLLSVAISLAVCSELLGLRMDERDLALRVFVLVLGCFFGAYVGGPDAFWVRLALLAVPTSAAAALFVTPGAEVPGLASGIFYAVVIALALAAAHSDRPGRRAGEPWLRQGIVYAWAVAGTLLAASTLEPLAHPRPRVPEWMLPAAAQDLLYAHLVDLRVILSVIAGMVLLGAAIARMTARGPLDIPDIPRARVASLPFSGRLAQVVGPFIRAAVTVWTIVRAPANVLWKFVAHSAASLARIALEFVRLLVAEVFDPARLVRIAAQLALWLSLLALARGSGAASAALLHYLREAGDGGSATIVHLGAFFLLGLVGTVLIVRLASFLWLRDAEEPGVVGGRAAECASMLLLVFAASSAAVHVGARLFPGLEIAGFTRVGPVTGYVLGVFMLVIVALIIREVRERRPAGGA